MGKYIPNKHLIYLDQFALSRLVTFNPGTIWERLRHLLEKGVEERKIIVPYSLDHSMESCTSDMELAEREDAFLFDLSKGFMLDIEAKIAAKYIVHMVRNKRIGITIFRKDATHKALGTKESQAQFAERREKYEQMIKEGTSQLNTFREIARDGKKPDKKLVETSLQILVSNYQQNMILRLKQYSRYGFYDKRKIEFSFISIPFWADVFMEIMIHNHQLTQDEAKKAMHLLEREGLRKVMPTQYIRAAIEAMMMVKQQAEKVNDHVDIIRLCTALPFCDIVLTDKMRRYDITTMQLDAEFKTEIYSGTKEQLALFEERLSSIVEN
ncbi:MAG: hypothetical protein GXC73_14175 [Chitinophagaceae bacterium]|nr:hypothetical protein [Chitinophagaceae bacterium]